MAGRNLMRAVRVANFGGPEVMKVETNIPVPEPAEDQILIEVKSAGINPVDTYIRAGIYPIKPALPFTPGSDASGVVKQIGSKVTKVKPGDKVFVIKNASGSYAQFLTTEEKFVGLLGDNLTFQQGAGLGIPCYSAYRSLCLKAKSKVKSGNSVLVHGASGAVGLACIQIAVSRGMKVYGTAGSQEGLDLIKRFGATAVFNHKDKGYTTSIMEATNGEGPDVIIEMLANVNLESDLNMIKKNGIIVVVGNRGSIEINPRLTMQKESTIQGCLMWSTSSDEWTEMHTGIAEGIKSGWLVPQINKEYSLEEAPQAHEDIINGGPALGRRVLVV